VETGLLRGEAAATWRTVPPDLPQLDQFAHKRAAPGRRIVISPLPWSWRATNMRVRLRRRYLEQRLSVRDIADEVGM